MTTALAIITDALEMVGVASDSQPISPYETQTSLDRLNDIVDMWATQGMFAASTNEVVFQLTGQQTYVISPTGDIQVPSPAYINGGFVRIGAIDYSFDMVSYEQYSSIALKTIFSTWPSVAYYDSISKISFYPLSSGELHLAIPLGNVQFADSITDYPLQAGVKKALGYTLAEELSVVYGNPMPAVFYQKAAASRRMVKRLNLDVPSLSVPSIGGGGYMGSATPDPDGYQGGNAGDMLHQ